MSPEPNAPPSEALPVIWQDWDGFQAIAADLARTSAAFAHDARNGASQLKLRFADVTRTCVACHKDYRLKD